MAIAWGYVINARPGPEVATSATGIPVWSENIYVIFSLWKSCGPFVLIRVFYNEEARFQPTASYHSIVSPEISLKYVSNQYNAELEHESFHSNLFAITHSLNHISIRFRQSTLILNMIPRYWNQGSLNLVECGQVHLYCITIW